MGSIQDPKSVSGLNDHMSAYHSPLDHGGSCCTAKHLITRFIISALYLLRIETRIWQGEQDLQASSYDHFVETGPVNEGR